MNKHCLMTGMLIILSLVIGCPRENKPGLWSPNVSLLNEIARTTPGANAFTEDVKTFYQLLHDKQWHETYERRAKAFRKDCSESEYIRIAKQNEIKWGLVNYEILSVTFQDSDVAIVVCKFTELPDYANSYSVVFWHKEDGMWRCLSAGPQKMAIFEKTRPIVVNWN